ncbi:MAG TPA: hypothetical protein RMH99_22000 [Sandaracinaceae bacterium LLY-WYZ-13_1]|nr:hypothetical protein [Sandaracinaceae bacterium LLY-WYZ-13_1]
MSTEATLAAYRPRDADAADALPARLRGWWDAMRGQGVVTAREPWLLRSGDDCLLVFEWVSPQAARRAQDNPAINEALAAVEALAERIPPGELEDADDLEATLEVVAD